MSQQEKTQKSLSCVLPTVIVVMDYHFVRVGQAVKPLHEPGHI
jgi:hypothetical protein